MHPVLNVWCEINPARISQEGDGTVLRNHHPRLPLPQSIKYGSHPSQIFVCSIVLALFVAYGIGANDVANAFGSSVGACYGCRRLPSRCPPSQHCQPRRPTTQCTARARETDVRPQRHLLSIFPLPYTHPTQAPRR